MLVFVYCFYIGVFVVGLKSKINDFVEGVKAEYKRCTEMQSLYCKYECGGFHGLTKRIAKYKEIKPVLILDHFELDIDSNEKVIYSIPYTVAFTEHGRYFYVAPKNAKLITEQEYREAVK